MIANTPRFLDQGEATLVVEFGDSVDPEINAKVLFLDVELNSKKVSGLQETTPSYRSLLICYEPLELKRALLIEIIEEILSKLNNFPQCFQAASGRYRAVMTAHSLKISQKPRKRSLSLKRIFHAFIHNLAIEFICMDLLQAGVIWADCLRL